jgi:soluble lytic murein transglycosylase-like protein
MNSIHALALCILSLASPGGVTREHFARAPMGAQHRAASLATTFTIAADATGLDVALLTSLAFWESGFDGRAVSRNGSFGLLQLSPRYHWDIRGYCRAHPERCGVANIERGAKVLAEYKRRCKTDGAAIRGYRKGTCGPPTSRERKVLRTAAWIRRRIGGVK